MRIDPDLAGTPIHGCETVIEWRDMTNYAAAAGDANPLYFDDTRDAGIAAHPAFPVSVTWPILMTLNERLRSGAITKKVLATRVHYTEHLLLHRPIRAGDRLSISGAIAALLPHRAGTHAVIRLEARDPGGAPVFTEYLGAMFRGVSCSAEKGVENLPVPPEKPEQQDPGWEAAIDLPELSPYIYDGCTGIVFPIHTSPAFAKSVGLPGIIVQGTLTLAKALNEIVNREAGGDPLRVAEISVRFTGMVLPKTSIRVRKTGSSAIKGETAVFFEVLNADGEKAIRGGYARLR